MTLDEDAEAVYAALSEESPLEPAQIEAMAGVSGPRLEAAAEQLEFEGLAVRGYETDQGISGYSFSYLQKLGED